MTWGRQCWSGLRASIRAHPIRTPLLLLWFLQGPLVALIVLPPWGDLPGLIRPRTTVERCEAEVRDARQHGVTPVNVNREPYISMYWTEVQAACVRNRIEGR